MDAKYKPIPALPEKLERTSCDSSTTLDGLDEVATGPEYDNEVMKSLSTRQSRSIRPPNCLWLVQGVLFLVSLTMLILASTRQPSTVQHVKQFSAWSPAAHSVEYSAVRYNLTTKGNRFVGAGPEVDRAWREISYDMGDQWISKADIRKLDMPKSELMVDHPQTGEEGYRVGMEVFHQLHCINLLRRIAYREYYEPLGGEFAGGPEKLQRHADHCVEVLRVNTQCHADVGVFTLFLIGEDPAAWPRLNSNHVCRNFDKVRRWAMDHSVGNMELLE